MKNIAHFQIIQHISVIGSAYLTLALPTHFYIRHKYIYSVFAILDLLRYLHFIYILLGMIYQYLENDVLV